ncbi:MAG: TetR/AcrR family transcriptional regulator [Pseudomonadota bacterium]
MARPRKFDEGEVLGCAMTAFWRAGFEATTYRGLESETGVGLRSLHNAFGEKEALFARALDLYRDSAEAVLDQVFDPPGTDGLIALFQGMAAPLPADDVRNSGCLMVNTVFERADPPAEIAERVAGYRAMFRDRMKACLDADGIPEADARAEFLMGLLWGMLSQIRLARDTTAAAPMAAIAVQTIQGWRAG